MRKVFQILLTFSGMFFPFVGSNCDFFHVRFIRRSLIYSGFCFIKAFCVHNGKFQLLTGSGIIPHLFRRTSKAVCLREVPFFKDHLHLLVCPLQFICEDSQLAAQFFFLRHAFEQKLQDIFFIQFYQLFF